MSSMSKIFLKQLGLREDDTLRIAIKQIQKFTDGSNQYNESVMIISDPDSIASGENVIKTKETKTSHSSI